jgi:hypothetical protein
MPPILLHKLKCENCRGHAELMRSHCASKKSSTKETFLFGYMEQCRSISIYVMSVQQNSTPTTKQNPRRTPNSRLSSMFCRHSALLQCERPPRGRRNSRVRRLSFPFPELQNKNETQQNEIKAWTPRQFSGGGLPSPCSQKYQK